MNPDRLRRLRAAVPSAAVLAACLLAYAPALRCGFVGWDDEWLITGNPWLRAPSARTLSAVLDPRADPDVRGALGEEYLPVRDLSHAAEFALWGGSPLGFHAVNLGLHVLACLLLHALVARLSGSRVMALAAALLFAVHPLHAEPVAWLAGR
ncbi:MAG: hypothetical protein MUC63_00970 [Planctomycetes bacterium]|nr:hypothetical protein [Planctomycetota bacterium]